MSYIHVYVVLSYSKHSFHVGTDSCGSCSQQFKTHLSKSKKDNKEKKLSESKTIKRMMTDVGNRTAETTTKFLIYAIEMKFESYRSTQEGGE